MGKTAFYLTMEASEKFTCGIEIASLRSSDRCQGINGLMEPSCDLFTFPPPSSQMPAATPGPETSQRRHSRFFFYFFALSGLSGIITETQTHCLKVKNNGGVFQLEDKRPVAAKGADQTPSLPSFASHFTPTFQPTRASDAL